MGDIEGEWVYEENPLPGLVDEDGKAVVGVWKHISEDGKEMAEETVRRRLTRATGPLEHGVDEEDDEEGAQSDGAESSSRSRSASPLFPSRPSARSDGEEVEPFSTKPTSRSRSASPLFPIRATREAPTQHPRSPSPLFFSRPTVAPPESSSLEADDTATTQSLGSSPISASRTLSSPEPEPTRSTTEPSNSVIISPSILSSVPAEIRAQANDERRRDLGLLSSLLGEAVVKASAPKMSTSTRRNEWAGFAESDEDEDESLYAVGPHATSSVLRLRGGAGSDEEEDEDDSDEDSSDDSDSSSDEDADSDDSSDESTSAESGPKDTAEESEERPAGGKASLKDMFASSAAPATGFSLAGLGADVEIDEDLDIPITTSAPPQPAEDEIEGLTLAPKSFFDPSPDIPMFFPPPPGRAGAQALEEGKGFWRQETDEEMRAIWEKDKLALTREWKARHRDAKKQRRRKGATDLE